MGRRRVHTTDMRVGESWEWEESWCLLVLKQEWGLVKILDSIRAWFGSLVKGAGERGL